MQNVSLSNYSRGQNARVVTLGPITVWFSYATPVAFVIDGGDGIVVRQNDWSTTTGGHLAAIDGGDKEAKAKRIAAEQFETALSRVLPRPAYQ